MNKLLLRKFRSAVSRVLNHVSTAKIYFRAAGDPAILIDRSCNFGPCVQLSATDGGSIELGARVSLGNCVQIVARSGSVFVGDDVHIGDGSIVVSQECIRIGPDTLIAEYVVIRDQDHDTRTRPIRTSGFLTSPIHIGRDVWIGAKATVLRGSIIGDGAVVGAHALVKGNIPSGALAVGVPAKVVRSVEERE